MFQLLNGLLFLLLQDPTAAVDAAKSVETPVVTPAATAVQDTAASVVNDEKKKPRTLRPVSLTTLRQDLMLHSMPPPIRAMTDAAAAKEGVIESTDAEAELPPAAPGKAWVAWVILLLVIAVPILLANHWQICGE